MKKIKIPEYDVIAPSIESDAYIGWKYKARIYENLYFLIEYVNYQVIGQEKVKNPFWVFSYTKKKTAKSCPSFWETNPSFPKPLDPAARRWL